MTKGRILPVMLLAAIALTRLADAFGEAAADELRAVLPA